MGSSCNTKGRIRGLQRIVFMHEEAAGYFLTTQHLSLTISNCCKLQVMDHWEFTNRLVALNKIPMTAN